jgi:hypothetical protein
MERADRQWSPRYADGRRAASRALRALVGVAAVICAIAPVTLAAPPASTGPTPEPLWNAYPLENAPRSAGPSTYGQGRGAGDDPAQRAAPAAAGASDRDSGGGSTSRVTPVVVGALTGLATFAASAAASAAAVGGLRLLARRRARALPPAWAPRTALEAAPPRGPAALPARDPQPQPVRELAPRPEREDDATPDGETEPESALEPEPVLEPEAVLEPEPEPVPAPEPVPEAVLAPVAPPPPEDEHCRIEWWTVASGAQFRAMGTNRSGRRYVAGRSATLPDPRSPLRQAATLEAFEALVRQLEKRGWMAEQPGAAHGSPWYAQSFQRPRRPQRKPGRPEGGAP